MRSSAEDIVSRFRRIHAGDRGLIAGPWTPLASLCYRESRGIDVCAVQGLTQKGAPRFHLNYVPRHGHQLGLGPSKKMRGLV